MSPLLSKLLLIPAVAGLLLAGSAGSQAQSGSLVMLHNLKKGQWDVRYRDGSGVDEICLATGEELIALRHRDGDCNRYVIEDDAARVIVQYTCAGDGYGRTVVRRETSGLVQLESQGIAGGLPFQFLAEARRTGACKKPVSRQS